jgi:outer membrane protein assembly factor BamE (lipoprotein component of BamABCDE complex)
MLRIIIIICGLMLLSGCQGLNNRGFRVDKDALNAVKTAHLSKEQVIELLGEPTIVPDYTPNTWYYVSRIVRDKVWSRPSIKSQTIVKITFQGDYVKEVVVNNKKPVVKFDVDRADTESKGTEENAIQTFVKNFGRFNKTSRKQRR